MIDEERDHRREAELIHLAQAGDRAAFDALATRHYPRLYRILRRLLSRSADAEDIAQETMLAAWRHLANFRHDAAFVSWIHGIALRRGVSELRRRARDPALFCAEDDAAAAPPENEPHALAEKSELSERLRNALARLPKGQFQAAALYYYGEYSCAEIAVRLNIAESTVRAHLRRARTNLHRLLSEEETP
jgi:RNA polymerase sigma-70 factor (ECF subfamily)